MKKIMTKIVTVIALLTFSFAAVAQQNPARYFKRLDVNQDGAVTPDEFKAHSNLWMDKRGWTDEERRAKVHLSTFKKRDGNSDGEISLKEFIASS
ncbi:MAG: EF-hand domain-containing protein [Cellvibrionales bacterium]|nr:EF-hand domain-containing protein [Cellvibrionales bacterium]